MPVEVRRPQKKKELLNTQTLLTGAGAAAGFATGGGLPAAGAGAALGGAIGGAISDDDTSGSAVIQAGTNLGAASRRNAPQDIQDGLNDAKNQPPEVQARINPILEQALQQAQASDARQQSIENPAMLEAARRRQRGF